MTETRSFAGAPRLTSRSLYRAGSWLLWVGAAWGCRDSTRTTAPAIAQATPSGERHVAPPTLGHGVAAPSAPQRRDVTAGDRKTQAQNPGSRMRLAMEELTWTFEDATFGRIDVVVVLPDRRADERFPLLIALHGRGEAMKGPERGARGWVDDYALRRAIQRLGEPPLTVADFEGFVTESRLQSINDSLSQSPYGGLVVLCPYTPDMLAGDKPFERARPYAKFLVETLLPRARRELPVLANAAATGIDGVSLGGRVGFLSGLYQAESFHTVAGLQAAFDVRDAAALGTLGDAALARNPNLQFRLLTSDRDYFIDANQAIALEYKRRHLPVQLDVVPGPHDYVFNRGPGSIEMLYFHDRALRRALDQP